MPAVMSSCRVCFYVLKSKSPFDSTSSLLSVDLAYLDLRGKRKG